MSFSVEDVALADYEIPLSQAEVVETGEQTEGMIVSCMEVLQGSLSCVKNEMCLASNKV